MTEPSKYGLKLNLNHKYPENRSQKFVPRWGIIWTILPLIIRYIIYYIKCKIFGKSIVMDYVHVQRAKQIYGVPIGGIGCGAIGRGFRGEFCRFQLKPGICEWNTVDANQFIITIQDSNNDTIFQSRLSTFPTKSLKTWQSNIDGSKCLYTGLYPRSWTEYDLSEYDIKLVCRQISPVFPDNYKDTSLPCAVFAWQVINVGTEVRTVSIAFTFKNGTGTKSADSTAACSSKPFSYCDSEGVVLYNTINKMQCTYALSVQNQKDVTVSKCLYFDPNSDGSKPWLQLKHNGRFDPLTDKHFNQMFGEMAVGIAAKTIVPASEESNIEMSLVWDMPTISFPVGTKKYNKFYTKFFGKEGAILKMVDYTFKNYKQWETEIENWQKPVLDNVNVPDWYKGALFNETYYVSDGGSVWVDLNNEDYENFPAEDPRRDYGKFFYLEGHEYRMCNTYDVHFYASYALQINWPMIQKVIQYDFKDSVFAELPIKMTMLFDGKTVERKVPNTVPHDLGDPGEEPFVLYNAYPIHDVSEWRDLNTKFVLQVFRDFCLSGKKDVQYLQDMYDACYAVMHRAEKFDIDNDGLIENSGHPDQTFDIWTMTGSSAYCGGLWLAALWAMCEMSNILGKTANHDKFMSTLQKGVKAFEKKLWNGTYYNFDCSEKEYKSIMADQLCGHWYLRNCGFKYEVFNRQHVAQSLDTIYKNNVLAFCNGTMGAVNGFVDGEGDNFAVQSQEVWTGVTYALASLMIHEGMVEEAFKTAGGMYSSLTEKFGLAFDTPEAIYAQKYYRAIGYMRPLSIWSMQLALEKKLST